MLNGSTQSRMGNDYGYRLDAGRDSQQVLGYELWPPITMWGLALIVITFSLTIGTFTFDSFYFDGVPPTLVALGTVIVLGFLAYLAEDLKKLGLRLLLGVSLLAVLLVVPFVIGMKSEHYDSVFDQTYDADVAYTVGLAFFIYLGIVIWLTVSRLRWK